MHCRGGVSCSEDGSGRERVFSDSILSDKCEMYTALTISRHSVRQTKNLGFAARGVEVWKQHITQRTGIGQILNFGANLKPNGR